MRKNHLYALSKIKTIEKLIRKNFFTILAVSTSFLLVLTSWNAHKINLLKPQVQISPFGPEEGKLIVTAKAYTHEESKIYLQRDLVDRGVQPLEVTIQNNTDKKYSVTASSVDLPRIDPKKVAFKVTKSAIPRSVAWKIASFLFWPLSIPGTIDGIRTWHNHQLLKKNFNAKSFKDEVILPFSTMHRVLFVPQDKFKTNFDVTLIDIDTLRPTVIKTSSEGEVLVSSEKIPTLGA